MHPYCVHNNRMHTCWVLVFYHYVTIAQHAGLEDTGIGQWDGEGLGHYAPALHAPVPCNALFTCSGCMPA